MVSAVGGVDVAVEADAEAVGEGEVVLAADLAPGVEEAPFPVEDHHWVGAATEDEDVVVRVDADVGDLDERPSLRTLEEALDDLVAVSADLLVPSVSSPHT